jgi:hypothetical protein
VLSNSTPKGLVYSCEKNKLFFFETFRVISMKMCPNVLVPWKLFVDAAVTA